MFVDLVGRLRELRALEDLLERAAGGSGGLLVVSGPGGSGRTALADAAVELARKRGFQVVRAVPARGQPGRLIWAQLLADVGAAQAAARLLEGGAGPLQPVGAADRLAAAGDAPGAVMATARHAMLAILRGRFEEAERLAVEVAEAGRRAGVADTERLAGTLRGQVAAERDPSTWPWWPPRPGTRPPRRRCTTRLGPTTTGWWSGVALSPPAGRCRITSACWRSGWGGSTTPSATCRRRSTCRSESGPCPAWPTAWPPWPTP
ncbi:MAG: ATP-binding protein [Actinomycetes bacterium]